MNVVFHTGNTPDWAAPLERPWPLLPVGNRPWLEFWIEWCVARGFTALHLVLGDGAAQVEHAFGSGERWGVSITYHFVRDVQTPAMFLRRSPDLWRDGLLHVAAPVFPRRADDQPLAPLDDATRMAGEPSDPAVFYSRRPVDIEAYMNGAAIAPAPFAANELLAQPLATLADYFDLNLAMVDGEIARYLTPGYRREDRAYLGFNVVYPSSATIAAPVMIGNDVRLRGLATIGPRAILGNRVIVDRQATVTESLVLDGTYLGPGIELAGRIACGRRLIDPADGTTVDIEDTHWMAPLRAAGGRGEKLRRIGHCTAALLLWITVAPLAIPLLLLGMIGGGRFVRQPLLGVRGSFQPLVWRPGRWSSGLIERLSLHDWPRLAYVVRGDLWLSGQLPVTPDEEAEVRDWPAYRPGLFAYADMRPDREDPVLRRIEACYYAHHRGWGEDVRICLLGWWARVTGRNRRIDDREVPA